MAAASDHFPLDLENHRLHQEDRIIQLRKALRHWQTWDAEYETLKDVEAVPDSLDDQAEELYQIKRNYNVELLQERELEEFFGSQALRTKVQVVNLLKRRTDYVTRNIESLQKQVKAAEDRLAADTVFNQTDATDENGELITDIIEELDNDDNIVSYRVSRPGDSMPPVRAALEKAGMGELLDEKLDVKPLLTGQPLSERPEMQPKYTLGAPNEQNTSSQKPAPPPRSASPTQINQVTIPENVRKNDTSTSVSTPGLSRTAKRVERIMKTAKEQEEVSMQKPVISPNEEPEDALLRQKMLKYSMGEVGAVVAELQLEEGDSDDDESFDDADESLEDTDEDEEDDNEDVYGRSKGSIITDDYRRRMLELEKKLGIKSHSSHTKDTEDEDSGTDEDQGIGHIVVRQYVEMASSSSKPPPAKSNIREKQNANNPKKEVHFAPTLDVASDDATAAFSPVEQAQEPRVDSLGDIIERPGVFSQSESATKLMTSRRLSRFKREDNSSVTGGSISRSPLDVSSSSMHQENREPLTCPAGMTLSDQIVEREPRANPLPPTELDDLEGYGAVAGEYQRLRKRFIQRQGGFLQEDTSPVQEIDEASENLSRFMAARLSRQ